MWIVGSSVKLRPDWEVVKVRVMYDGNRAKFEQHPERAKNLVNSGRGAISFGASSAFWCHWNARIMTLLREELREEKDRDNDLIQKIWKEIDDYEQEQKARLDVHNHFNNNNDNA